MVAGAWGRGKGGDEHGCGGRMGVMSICVHAYGGLGSFKILNLYAWVQWARTARVQASVLNALQHRPIFSLR